MQSEKKQLEILLMDYFRRCYTEFPKGGIVASESPDFLVKLKSKNTLGIELTRLNPGNAAEPNKKQLLEIDKRESLITFTKELFYQHSQQSLFVKFLFSEKKNLLPEKEMMLAVKISRLILNAVNNKSRDGFFTVSIKDGELPDEIDELFIANHPKLETGIWERSNNLGISTNVVDDIVTAIHKKDDKLRLYYKNHLNYYWLLITTDRLRGVKSLNLPNKIRNHKFESHFQHVFLFDLIKSEVYEIV